MTRVDPDCVADDNYRGAWKDIFNGAIAYGINFGKDSLR